MAQGTIRRWGCRGLIVLMTLCWLVPARAQAAPLTVTGKVTIGEVDDFTHHKEQKVYWIDDQQSGQRYNLHFKDGEPDGLRSGARMRVSGEVSGKELVAESAGAVRESAEAPSLVVTGEQRTVVLGINFSDEPLDCTLDSIETILFASTSSVASLYSQMSNGSLWFTGDLYGPYTIPFSSTGTCDYQDWANAAESAAEAQGVDLSVYAHKIYVFPSQNPCAWAGLGTIGGEPGLSWIAYCDLPDVYAHELGHNLGMHHSSTDPDNGGTNECEYCDVSDFMGYSGLGLREVNGPHMDQMGWLPSGQVVLASTSMVITLAPLEWDPQTAPYPQLLKIANPNADEFYYFSYRVPMDCDTNLESQYAESTSVHHYQGSGAIETYLIANLQDNGTFTDAVLGVTVTQLAHDENTVRLSVNFGGGGGNSNGCTPATPVAGVSPAGQSAEPGETVESSLTVSNTDSGSCGGTTFSFYPSSPAGWMVSVAPSSLTLAAGQAGAVNLFLTPPGEATNGEYDISIGLSDNALAVHGTTVMAPVTVSAPPPPAPTHLSASRSRGLVELRWTENKHAAGVTGYAIWRDGVQIDTATTNRYTDATAAAGQTHYYYVVALETGSGPSGSSNTVKMKIPAPRKP